MSKKSRTKTVYINSIVTMITQIIQVLLGFIVRKLFINYLGVEYLGYNSVFSNILQMLNLADMGIGVAITSFLYKPLAQKDDKRIKALMYIYKKIYGIMGIIVLIIGIIISFFLSILIPDATCSHEYLLVLFYINLAATISTYYLAYKRTLLIADQKTYMISVIDTGSYFVMTILQICILLFCPNYILYLVITLAKNVVANIIISFKCNSVYGKIENQRTNIYYNEYKPQILTFVKDVFISRIGAFVYYSTDNIIISIFKGSLLTGYLSNYTLITTQITNVVNQILASIQATFGNFINVNNDKECQKEMTDNYLCVNYCIGNFCFICLFILVQPFIKLVFGQKYMLEITTVVLLSINLMLNILIQLPSQLFMIYKLYRFDRPIIIVSALLNIVISVVLVKPIGIDGVLIGTLLTSLIYLFSRFFVISKYVYNISYFEYLSRLCGYGLVSSISIIAIYFSTRGIQGETIISFCIQMFFVGLLAIMVPASLLCWTKEFTYLKNKLLPSKIKKICSNKMLYITTIVFILLSIFVGKCLYYL